MPIKKTKQNPLGLSPAELQLVEYHRIKRGNAKGGRNAWKGMSANERSTEAKRRANVRKQRSAAMRAVALAKAAKP